MKVITYGTFDLLHYGHIRLLKRAKALGDHLTVALSTDEFNTLKGKQAVMTYEERKEVLEALECVDCVIPEESWEQKATDEYDIMVMGEDWRGKFDSFNCVYVPRTEDISTTDIKRRMEKVA